MDEAEITHVGQPNICYITYMETRGRYQFRKAIIDDQARVAHWQSAPQVAMWWDDEPPFDEAELADPRVARWIVSYDDRLFAYMQDYSVHGWDEHHFAHLPPGTRGIDQFIGEADMLDKGHGSAFIGMRMQALFAAGAPMIATDPHPDNARAIAVYQKLGFEVVGPPQQTQWGLVLPMVARK